MGSCVSRNDAALPSVSPQSHGPAAEIEFRAERVEIKNYYYRPTAGPRREDHTAENLPAPVKPAPNYVNTGPLANYSVVDFQKTQAVQVQMEERRGGEKRNSI